MASTVVPMAHPLSQIHKPRNAVMTDVVSLRQNMLQSPMRLTLRDAPRAGNVLAKAFFYDPGFVQLMPDDLRRGRLLPKLATYIVREGIIFGESFSASNAMEGVAVWHRPNISVSLFARMFRVGYYRAPYDFGVRLAKQLLEYGSFLDAIHDEFAPKQSWYLQMLGVNPEYQGHGYAKRLLLPMLKQFDADGVACFLETLKESNLPMYERFGFHVVHRCVLPHANIDCWFMQRNAKTSGNLHNSSE